MRRSAFVIWALLIVIGIGATVAIPQRSATAATTEWTYYKDKFVERDYDGNDAGGEFSTDWNEVGEANGPTKGYVSVSDHDYCYGFCLQIGDGGLAVGNVGIERSVNLEGAIEAKLTYIFATDLYGGSTDEEVALQISANAGQTFTTIETYVLGQDQDMERQDYIDITDWAAPQTVVRFISVHGANKNVLLIDDFLVKGKFTDGPPPATTSTTSTSTTTTSTTTTSTTTLPPTTTTTTRPPVDTTSTTRPTDNTSSTTPSTTVPPTTTTTTTTPSFGATGVAPPGSDASFFTKDALVVTDVARPEVPGDGRVTAGANEPVSLAVSFRTTAEAFTGGALPATVLGVLIAVLAVIGLSRGLKPEPEPR